MSRINPDPSKYYGIYNSDYEAFISMDMAPVWSQSGSLTFSEMDIIKLCKAQDSNELQPHLYGVHMIMYKCWENIMFLEATEIGVRIGEDGKEFLTGDNAFDFLWHTTREDWI